MYSQKYLFFCDDTLITICIKVTRIILVLMPGFMLDQER